MRKGLTLTLMTVAVAMLSFQAMAMAPVIDEIPSPIVGNQGATAPNSFVYPDAINLNNYVSDPDNADDQIRWSYAIVTDATHPQRYMFNGIPMLDLATDDPKTPGTKAINLSVAAGEINLDSNPVTVTVRNSYLSPLGGPEKPTGTQTGPVLDSETQMVTLFASDGTTYTQKELLIYTDKTGPDRLSPGGVVEKQYTFVSSTNGYTWGGSGSITSSVTANGLCFTVAAAGDNSGQWTGKMGDIDPVANSVYKIRLTVSGSNTDWNLVPFWDFYVENYDWAADTGANLYGQDCYFLGNTGGANAALTTARSYDMWFAPLAFDTPQWKTGFPTLTAAQKKGRVNFRVMDYASRSDIGLQLDQGTICVKDLTITRFPYSAMQVVKADCYNNTALAPNTGTNGNVSYGDSYNGSTASYSGGAIITPTTSGQANALGTLVPATNTNWGTLADKYPVKWDSNCLYQITAELSAVAMGTVTQVQSEANPFDIIWLGVDQPGNEANMQGLVSNKGGLCATPKAAAATYMVFWWSHNESTSLVATDHYFRPRLDVGSNPSLTVGNNSGSIKVTKFEVKKVRFE